MSSPSGIASANLISSNQHGESHIGRDLKDFVGTDLISKRLIFKYHRNQNKLNEFKKLASIVFKEQYKNKMIIKPLNSDTEV